MDLSTHRFAKIFLLLSLSLTAYNTSAQTVCADNSSDPDGDGWGWENGASCTVVAESTYEFRFANVGKPADADWARTIIAASEEFVFAQSGSQVHVVKRISERDFENYQVINLSNDDMGCSADIDDDVAVIGSCTGDSAATVYRHSNGVWQTEAVIDAPVLSGYHATAVAIKGNVVAIASPSYRPGFPQTGNGVINLYRLFDGGNWEPDGELSGDNSISNFASQITMPDQNTLVVGRGIAVPSSDSNCEGGSGSGCAFLHIGNEIANRGGIGIFSYSDSGTWDYQPRALPPTTNNDSRLGTAVASNENTIVFSGRERTDMTRSTLHVVKKQSDNSWAHDQKLTVDRVFTGNPDIAPTLSLSADGTNLAFSAGSGSLLSNATVDTFEYSTATGFSPAGSLDNVNENHGVINDRIVTVRTGHVVLYRRVLETQGTSITPPTAGCDYSNADLYGGWGWNATLSESCPPVTSTIAAICVDSDGDGWGWDGTQSCRVGDSTTQTNNPEQNSIPFCSLSLFDPDGDGWGWENGQSCIVED